MYASTMTQRRSVGGTKVEGYRVVPTNRPDHGACTITAHTHARAPAHMRTHVAGAAELGEAVEERQHGKQRGIHDRK